ETQQVTELLLQSLEHERGGIKIYETALKCVVNDELREEWEKYREESQNHEDVLIHACQLMGIDPEALSDGRRVVALVGHALVEAMETALAAGKPEAAELVACECV